MNRRAHAPVPARFRALALVCALVCVLGGCRKTLPPGEFVEAYRKEYGSEFLRGDYKITVLPLSDAYLAARLALYDSGGRPVPTAAADKNGMRISVQVELRESGGGPEDQRKDILNGALSQGADAFSKRRRFLDNEVAAYASLECDQERYRTVAYRFSPGIGFPAVHSFLFLFTPEKGGKAVSPAHCRFDLKDIGMGFGALEAPIPETGRYILKKRDQT
jgi:hypothetical protein